MNQLYGPEDVEDWDLKFEDPEEANDCQDEQTESEVGPVTEVAA